MGRLEPASLASGISLPRAASLVSNRRLAIALALGIAAAAGLLTSLVAPRGPTTAVNALFVMAVALFVGATGGALVRSRWSLVVLFVVYFLGIEAGRLNIVGPSLDLRLDNPYGIIAFVLTRGIHSILVLPPLAFGVLVGLAVARRLGWSPRAYRRRLPVGSAFVGALGRGAGGPRRLAGFDASGHGAWTASRRSAASRRWRRCAWAVPTRPS